MNPGDIYMHEEAQCVLHIRNMVCPRCIMAVQSVLDRLGIQAVSVQLGQVTLASPLHGETLQQLKDELSALGFELLSDHREQIAEQIKNEIVKLVHYSGDGLKVNLSDYLSGVMNSDYSRLSKIFSEVTGSTIEKYFIAQKTERVKELLGYGELTLSQIADIMNYSSTAHLSAQFKAVTGITPTEFRRSGAQGRQPLDKV